MLRLVVLTTLVVGILLLGGVPTSHADDPLPFRATTRAEFPQTRAQQQTSKEDSKVSSIIRGVLQNLETASITRSNAQTTDYSALSVDGVVRINESGEIHSYIYTTSTDQNTLQELEALGARIELTNHQHAIVQAWIPFDKLEAIADLSFVKRIRTPGYAVTRSGSVTTEGDAILKADLVRNLNGITGAGVKIGVISDGADSWQDARDSGDEGTAMLEIIHDIAPNASLAFSSGFDTSLDMIETINYLANDAFDGTGVDIIVDDIGFFDQPFFEDGPIAQAVQDVVNQGTIYISSAGNQAQEHYEADFVPGPPGDFEDFHAFSTGDQGLTVLVPAFGSIRVVMQWNDGFGSSGNDYDLFVCDSPDVFLEDCDNSISEQDGDDFPFEWVLYRNPSLSVEVVSIFIDKFSGSAKRLEVFILDDALAFEYPVPQGSIFGHAAVDGAIAVGSIDAADSGHDTIRSFSSQGPSDIFFPSFESRSKPDVTAIDGVSITGAGGFHSPFAGTSAAAPHAAAVAALVLEAIRIDQPGISKVNAADLVFSTLQDTAVDLGAAGFDNVFGAGRLDALAASDFTPPLLTIESITTPLSPLLLAGKDMETEVVFRADEPLILSL
jgi:subtilisin family serine protease